MKILIVFLCTLLSMAVSKLYVYHPTVLRNKIDRNRGIIGSSLANFGNVPYGHSTIGRVWFDKDNADGCEDFTIKVTGEGDPDAQPSPIVLVNRGNCPFTKKVRNIEHAGGTLAIIIDNKTGEKVDDVIMVDDGSGNGINIPSMLISMEEGKIILDVIKNCEQEPLTCVQLMAQFEMPNPDNRVEYDLWYTSASEPALDFIKNFEEHHLKFGKHVLFTPRIVTWGCTDCEKEMKSKNCFGDGKYCVISHEQPDSNGQDILYEGLRQKCLHEHLLERKEEKKWWEYMHKAHSACKNDISEKCSKDVMDELNLPFKVVIDCVNESFYSRNHAKSDNSILSSESLYWSTNGPHFFPAVIINNVTYRGALNPDNVFQAICNGFKDAPAECKADGTRIVRIIEGMSISTLLMIVLGIVGINVILLVCYRRYYKKELEKEIRMTANAAVSQYFAIQNFDKYENSRAPSV